MDALKDLVTEDDLSMLHEVLLTGSPKARPEPALPSDDVQGGRTRLASSRRMRLAVVSVGGSAGHLLFQQDVIYS